MLGVIMGNAEMAMDRMVADDPIREDIREFLDAAQRSMGITRQLLAFARRQIIAPVVLDLNEAVESTLKMLHPEIGVLYMSGYTANVIAHRGDPGPRRAFYSEAFQQTGSGAVGEGGIRE